MLCLGNFKYLFILLYDIFILLYTYTFAVEIILKSVPFFFLVGGHDNIPSAASWPAFSNLAYGELPPSLCNRQPFFLGAGRSISQEVTRNLEMLKLDRKHGNIRVGLHGSRLLRASFPPN